MENAPDPHSEEPTAPDDTTPEEEPRMGRVTGMYMAGELQPIDHVPAPPTSASDGSGEEE